MVVIHPAAAARRGGRFGWRWRPCEQEGPELNCGLPQSGPRKKTRDDEYDDEGESPNMRDTSTTTTAMTVSKAAPNRGELQCQVRALPRTAACCGERLGLRDGGGSGGHPSSFQKPVTFPAFCLSLFVDALNRQSADSPAKNGSQSEAFYPILAPMALTPSIMMTQMLKIAMLVPGRASIAAVNHLLSQPSPTSSSSSATR